MRTIFDSIHLAYLYSQSAMSAKSYAKYDIDSSLVHKSTKKIHNMCIYAKQYKYQTICFGKNESITQINLPITCTSFCVLLRRVYTNNSCKASLTKKSESVWKYNKSHT